MKKLLVCLFLGLFLFTNFSLLAFAGDAEPTPEELNAYFESERKLRKAKEAVNEGIDKVVEQEKADLQKYQESVKELEKSKQAVNEGIDRVVEQEKADLQKYQESVTELEKSKAAVNEGIDKAFKDLKTKQEVYDYIKANAENPKDYEGASFDDAVKAYESELELKAAQEDAAGAVDRGLNEAKLDREALDKDIEQYASNPDDYKGLSANEAKAKFEKERNEFAANRSQELEEAVDEANSRTTILPSTTIGTEDCKGVMNYVLSNSREIKQNIFEQAEQSIIETISVGGKSFNLSAKNIMGCAVKTGQIKLWMIPYFVRQFLEFIITLGGLISVGGIVYGGYLYMFAGISDDKEKGKKAIMYAVAGMILTMVAWAFVNIVISIVT